MPWPVLPPAAPWLITNSYSQGELDELIGENYGLIEQEKLTQMHDMNQLLGRRRHH